MGDTFCVVACSVEASLQLAAAVAHSDDIIEEALLGLHSSHKSFACLGLDRSTLESPR